MKLWHGPRERRDFFAALAFLTPNFLGFLAFTAGPVLLSLYMSFTNWNLKPAIELEWVGLRNYVDLLQDRDFWFYLYNTFYFMLGIPFAVGGSLLLANILVDSMQMKNARLRYRLSIAIAVVGLFTCTFLFMGGKHDMALLLAILYVTGIAGILWGSMTFRTMLYIPNFASGVATIVLWTQIYNPEFGLANNVLEGLFTVLGVDVELPKWLISRDNILGFLPLPGFFNSAGFGLGAREAIIIMGVWMGIGGNNMILYIASISNIPQAIYEAADIDGAGAFSKLLRITIPSVAPTTFFIMIMAVIGGLQGGFQFARIMTQGGPAGTTTTLAYYIFTAGFEDLRFGYASSVAWVMFVIIFALTLVNWKYGNRRMEM